MAKSLSIARAAVLATAAALLSQPAFAQAGVRPITKPTVISEPGSYILTRSLSLAVAGSAIVIAADNVTVNLNGHTLSGPGGTQGVGVLVEGASGAHVFGGIVTRFATAVEVRSANNVKIDGLQIHGEDAGGPPGEVGVLILNSRAVFVERNVISRIFLGIFVRGGGSGGNRIVENTLAGEAAGQLGICYNPDTSGSPAGPSGDLVYNNLISRFNIGIQTSTGTSGNIFRENDIAYFQVAIQELGPGQNVFEENTTVAIQP